MNKNYFAYLLLILTTIFWSGNFIVGKAASFYQIPPFTLNFYRWFFASLILIPFTYKEIFNERKYIIDNFGLFIILGFTSITIFNSIVYYSLYFTQVITGLLMISTIPVWIILISFILNIEKTNSFQIIGVVCSLVGVIIIITKIDLNIIINLNFNKGDISMVIAMFAWAIFSILLKKKKHEISQLALLQVVIFCGLILLTPIYLMEMKFGNVLELKKPFYLILAYVIFFPGIFAFLFWIKGISIIGANRAGVFLHLMPIIGAIMAIVIFKEKFMYYHLIGAIFIIVGITLSNKRNMNYERKK